ncbi:DUF4403 family protein [Paraglaciecola aquimarina]|uniref:DUF4403 family protein n=1 Tax=Paraglaciecola algarum TaxID=3050085 RepID=A0ABS9D8C6_9ALTE|nr:DUF4403 family protein [Paraglaciecola sp. G1-23]MCF2947921.1 DUF4403 family protein [Paraglaciecola sp. G1-23]
MHRISRFFIGFMIWFGMSVTHASSITDELIVALVESNLPQTLYTEKDRAWELGVYDLIVNKRGKAVFTSTARFMSLTVPIEVKIQGQINKQLLSTQIVVNCSSNILTETRIDLEPLIKLKNSSAKVEISVPVPQSFLDCEGLKVNITPLLKTIVTKEKQEWQQQLEQELQTIFKQLSL